MKKTITYLQNNLEVKETLLSNIENENDLLEKLTIYIQELIDTDFQYFLWVLYKIDVDEKKVRETIKKDPQNSSKLIAQLIIDRVNEKIITREKYKEEDDREEGDWIFL